MALHSYNNIDVFVTSFPALCMFFLGICPRTQIHLEPPYFRRVNMGRYHPFCKNMACLQCLVWKQFVYTLLSLGKQRVMLARLFFILKLDFCLQPTWGIEGTEDFFLANRTRFLTVGIRIHNTCIKEIPGYLCCICCINM